jgi:predicted alpha/beta superfamily hydrolase
MRCFVFCLFVILAAFAVKASEISMGRKVILHSDVIGEDRPIWIYTPVHEKDERLHVIYLLDGAEHFHTVTGVVKSLSDYGLMPKAMVVGIETTSRPRDYLPKVVGQPQNDLQAFISTKWPNSGQTDNFLNFIRTELIPYIDKQYPTYPHRTLIGHSNAGTLALYSLFNQPDLFHNYLAMSPQGWWSHAETVSNAAKLAGTERPYDHLFISVGGEGGRFYSGTLDLLAAMEQNKPSKLVWKFQHYPSRGHMSGILPALSDGLEYLFGHLNFAITPEMAKYAEVSALTQHYTELSKKVGFVMAPPVNSYVDFAEAQAVQQRHAAAVTTSQQLVQAYPNLPYAHMVLGQRMLDAGQAKEAVASFDKALALGKAQKLDDQVLDALTDMRKKAAE